MRIDVLSVGIDRGVSTRQTRGVDAFAVFQETLLLQTNKQKPSQVTPLERETEERALLDSVTELLGTVGSAGGACRSGARRDARPPSLGSAVCGFFYYSSRNSRARKKRGRRRDSPRKALRWRRVCQSSKGVSRVALEFVKSGGSELRMCSRFRVSSSSREIAVTPFTPCEDSLFPLPNAR